MVSDLPELTQTILNLAEFMDHCEIGPLPIDTHLLGERSMNCRAYAKVLHYKEEEFIKEKNKRVSSNVIESLIYINNKLQQKEAVSGKVYNLILNCVYLNIKLYIFIDLN